MVETEFAPDMTGYMKIPVERLGDYAVSRLTESFLEKLSMNYPSLFWDRIILLIHTGKERDSHYLYKRGWCAECRYVWGQSKSEGIFYESNSCHQKLLFLPFNPSHRRYRSSVSPLYFAVQNTEEEGNTFLYIMFVLLSGRVP